MNKTSISRLFHVYLILFALAPGLVIGMVGAYQAFRTFQAEAAKLRSTFLESIQNELLIEAANFVRQIDYEKNQSEQQMRQDVRDRVEEALKIMENLQANYGDTMSRAKLDRLMMEILRPIRYNQGRCYYFVYRLDGTTLLNGAFPELEQNNHLDKIDAKGQPVVRNMIDLVKRDNSGFVTYHWPKPFVPSTPFPKVTYIAQVPGRDWFIGSGEYLDDLDRDNRDKMLRQFSSFKLDPSASLSVVDADGYVLMANSESDPDGRFWISEAGVSLIEEAMSTQTQGRAFFERIWQTGNTDEERIFVAIPIDDWGWTLLIGRSMDHVESIIAGNRKNLGMRILGDMITGVITLLVIMGLAIWTAQTAAARLRESLALFSDFFKKVAGPRNPEMLLNPESLRFREMVELAKDVNLMVEERDQTEGALRDSRRRLAEANEELRRQASLDGLTALPNRRAFDRRYQEEWTRAQRLRQTMALLMMDIDYFKAYNDHYGHQAGDDALRTVARLIKESVRATPDFPARYGGEEFAVVLPGSDLEGAKLLAERIRAEVETAAIPHEASKITTVVTLSIGVACAMPGQELTPEILVRTADQALYRAKEKGRNRVEASE